MRNAVGVVFIAAAVLSGCGSDDGGGDGAGGSSGSEIRSFFVTGTNGVISGGSQAVLIDAAQNGGLFGLDWDASSSTRPYRADLYLSTDQVLSETDQQFFGRNCDQPVGDCTNQAASFDCVFGTDVRITCPAGSDETTNLSTWLASNGGLPGSYVVILEVCDGLFTDCVTRSVPVVLQ